MLFTFNLTLKLLNDSGQTIYNEAADNWTLTRINPEIRAEKQAYSGGLIAHDQNGQHINSLHIGVIQKMTIAEFRMFLIKCENKLDSQNILPAA